MINPLHSAPPGEAITFWIISRLICRHKMLSVAFISSRRGLQTISQPILAIIILIWTIFIKNIVQPTFSALKFPQFAFFSILHTSFSQASLSITTQLRVMSKFSPGALNSSVRTFSFNYTAINWSDLANQIANYEHSESIIVTNFWLRWSFKMASMVITKAWVPTW